MIVLKNAFKVIVISSALALSSCDQLHKDIENYYSELTWLILKEKVKEKKYFIDYDYGLESSFFVSKQSNSTSSKISLLKFLSLKGCHLRYVVARKNSILGKVSPSSQKLKYEADFIHYAPDCIIFLKNNNEFELSEELTYLLEQKKRHLSKYIWQAVLGSSESKIFWQINNLSILSDYKKISGVKESLNKLNDSIDRLLNGDYQFDIDDFENNLGVLRKNIGGDLYRDIVITKIYLSKLNRIFINQNHIKKQFCFGPGSSEIFEELKQFVFRAWESELKIKTDELKKSYFEIIRLFQNIELKIVDAEPIEYANWRLNRDNSFEIGLSEIEKHSQQISQIKDICSLEV